MDRWGDESSGAGKEKPLAHAWRDSPESVPLVVDLDGTLVATDTLFESVLSLIRQSPASVLLLPIWLIRGKAVLKSEVEKRFKVDVRSLPYRPALLEYLRRERATGRKLVLATAAHEGTAYSAATHLDLFDEVVATTDSVNMKGTLKRDELVARFGVRGFDYIGDSKADTPVWATCRIGHVAGQRRALPAAVLGTGTQQGEVFYEQRPTLKTWMRAMRVQQWVKNSLVVVPTLLNHQLNWEVLKALAITFLAFSFVASGTYIANDLFDLAADRRHPRKCKRPLASGELSIVQGIFLAVCLLLAGILLGVVIGKALVMCLLIYVLLTLLYTSFLKGKPIIDVIALAILYTLRVYAGGLVTQAYVSPWLFQFSIFLFLSLAFVKRYSELRRSREQRRQDVPGRSYRMPDLSIISQAGVSSGLLAGLVLALYVNEAGLERIYPRPHMLWGVCPLFVYWIIRTWLIAHRGNMTEDPILFAFRDRVSYIVGFLIVVAVLLALTPNVD
jgi:4-hydroxybenzoate polyprenyltransferase